MRIAVVGPTHPYKGGIAQHTTELAHRLAARGHDVRLHSWAAQYPARLYPGEQRVREPEMEPFPRTDYPLSWRRPDSWWLLGRRLRRTADAVVLVVVTPVQAPAYLGILAGIRTGLGTGTGTGSPRSWRRGAGMGTGTGTPSPPVLALCHNVLPHERRAVDVPLVRAVLRRVNAVLVHTPAEAELARSLTSRSVSVAAMAPHLWTAARLRPPTHDRSVSEQGRRSTSGTPEGPAHPGDAGNARDTGDVPVPGTPAVPHPTDRQQAAEGAGPSGAAPTPPVRRRLLFFGLVRPYKGLDVLLRALAAGPDDVALTVAGEFWGGAEATRALVAELGLTDRVEVRPGYVPAADVPALFAAADALVLPYRSGTASQNVDLAHLHGLAVVASRVGTLADSVIDGVDGLLVPPGDVGALAASLHRLYEPGVLAALQAKVVPPDADDAWSCYLDAALAALAADSTIPACCRGS
jgi:glycosyltransferase involved in cell wall biosynthesis